MCLCVHVTVCKCACKSVDMYECEGMCGHVSKCEGCVRVYV